ncbi:MAG: biosynthetic-type acetolactate synthase large subunit [Treponema sp.]|jgi:acetolactate synthase-1/2/3 large subunit|nr:biosynthetic-type acetolactate synthase large subunit [Treponema sp.]
MGMGRELGVGSREKLSGARILVESLIEQGVEVVFGYPGGAVIDIYDELYLCQDRIRHVLVSHEQHAAHAADGYARSTGKTGVCLATSGPGATNLVTGIATAFVDSVPIVAITGNVSMPLLGKDSFQEVDIAGITMPIVKHNWIVEDVNDLARIICEAFIVASSGRSGPVLVDIPKDVISAFCVYNGLTSRENLMAVVDGRAGRLLEKTRRKTFTDTDIERAAELIKNSKRPLFFAGGGVINSGANAELQKLAELLGAPVALSLMGMGAFPREHSLCTGLIGMHGTEASRKALQKSDLLIAAGARFSDRVTSSAQRFARNAKIIHIDIDKAEIDKNVKTDVYIAGDLKTVLELLIKKIPKGLPTEWGDDLNQWKSSIKSGSKGESGKHNDHKRVNRRQKSVLHPCFVIQETARALGENTIAVTDVGQHQVWTAQFFPFKKPRTFLSSGGMGTMGYGMGAAAGAKIANPDTPVALFTGDGCFRMNSAEMATLVKYKLPVLIIIFNNKTLGMLRQWQNRFHEARYSETDLDNLGPDFIKLAEAYEISGFRAASETDFLNALEKSVELLASGKPALIEAIISKDEKALPMLVDIK